MASIPVDSMLMFVEHGNWRYVKVIYQDMIGWIWLPTNLPTHEVFELVKFDDDK